MKQVCFLVLGLVTLGCGDDAQSGTDGGAGSGGSMPRGTYEDVSAILGGPEQTGFGRCAASSCHGGDRARAELDFKGVEDITESLVNVPACENGDLMRVKPGSPDESWLWIKLTAELADPDTGAIVYEGTPTNCTGVTTGFGARMPYAPPFDKLKDEELFQIRTWIEDGAKGPGE